MKDGDFSGGLHDLAQVIDHALGGGYDYSTGVDYKNNVFEMWGFWAHCECSTCERVEWGAEESVLLEYGMSPKEIDDFNPGHKAYPDNYGTLYDARVRELAPEHDCPLKKWGFKHYGSDLEVKWYKRIGRSTESNRDMNTIDWHKTIVECLESVGEGR